jgi:hypothetical protein
MCVILFFNYTLIKLGDELIFKEERTRWWPASPAGSCVVSEAS